MTLPQLFYHRTICQSPSITHAVLGNFLDENQEDIVVSTGRILKLLRFEPGNKVVQTLISEDTYDNISSLSKFRRRNGTIDLIVFVSFCGRLTMLAAVAENMSFGLVYEAIFDQKIQRNFALPSSDSMMPPVLVESNQDDANIPRNFPTHYLTADSQVSAFCIASAESLVHLVFHPDPEKNEFFKFLQASAGDFVIIDIAFVDCDLENITIAYLAMEYEEIDIGNKYEPPRRFRPNLVFLACNKHSSTEIRRFTCLDMANSLISVPGKKGVLVCGENYIDFYSMDSTDIIRCPIPLRMLDPRPFVIFVCSSVYYEKEFQTDSNQKEESPMDASSSKPVECEVNNSIYYLAQTEQGDIFKIRLDIVDSKVEVIALHYFITLPVASALCVLKSGFLFVAAEFGNHYFYNLEDIENRARCQQSFDSTQVVPKRHFFFTHRIVDIDPVAEIESISPIIQMELAPLYSNRPQMYLTTGKASLSKLKISSLQPHISYQFCSKIDKEKDQIPLRMWAIESIKSISKERKLENLLVVSYETSTAVYFLKEAPKRTSFEKIDLMMEKDYLIWNGEANETLFATNISTIGCAKTGDDVIIQICPEGICLITEGKNSLIHKCIETAAIQCYAINDKTLVLAFGNKELKHYGINDDGFLVDSKMSPRIFNGYVNCIHLSDKNENNQLLFVGTSIPYTVSAAGINEVHLFVVSATEIKVLNILVIEESPYSFLLMNRETLLVGCEEGTLLTLNFEDVVKDSSEHSIEDVEKTTIKSEKIGSEAVQLLSVSVLGNECILAISDHSWVKKVDDESFIQLNSDLNPYVCVLPARLQISGGIATILEDSFRIFVIENLEYKPSVTIPLEYTPRKISIDSRNKQVFIIEADDKSHTEKTRQLKQEEYDQHVFAAKNNLPPPTAWKKPPIPPKHLSKYVNMEPKQTVLNTPKSWASVFRVVNLSKGIEEVNLPFEQNEAALSICHFEIKDGSIVLVGVAKNYRQSTACCDEAWINTYKVETSEENKILVKILHTIPIPSKTAPFAMCPYKGKVLIATGRKLTLCSLVDDSYQLSFECERKECAQFNITDIYPCEDRIYVSNRKLGISCLKYDSADNSLHLMEKDILPFAMTTACLLTDSQMIRASESRDIFVMELGTIEKKDVSRLFNEDWYKMSKENVIASFHVGEIVTSLQKFEIKPYEHDAIVYTTLAGSVGVLLPISCEKEAKFLRSLNRAFMEKAEKIDACLPTNFLSKHSKFRSRHFNWENVIDGDFLEECLKEVKHLTLILEEMVEKSVQEMIPEREEDNRQNVINRNFLAERLHEIKLEIAREKEVEEVGEARTEVKGLTVEDIIQISTKLENIRRKTVFNFHF